MLTISGLMRQLKFSWSRFPSCSLLSRQILTVLLTNFLQMFTPQRSTQSSGNKYFTFTKISCSQQQLSLNLLTFVKVGAIFIGNKSLKLEQISKSNV